MNILYKIVYFLEDIKSFKVSINVRKISDRCRITNRSCVPSCLFLHSFYEQSLHTDLDTVFSTSFLKLKNTRGDSFNVILSNCNSKKWNTLYI